MSRPFYVPLRNHTTFSLLEGMISPAKLVESARNRSIPALGLADTGHLFGAMAFSLACQEAHIQPILGTQLQLILAPHSESGKVPKAYSIIVYAKNAQGWRNVCILVSSSTVGQPSELRGCVTWETFEKHHEGLIVLTGGSKGPLDTPLRHGQNTLVSGHLGQLKGLLEDRLYIELSRQNREHPEKHVERELIALALENGIPLVATNEAFFLSSESYEAHDALRCIAQGTYVTEAQRPRLTREYTFRSPPEMAELFSDIPEALANTVTIAERCSFVLKPAKAALPAFPCPDGEEEELRKQSRLGLEKRLNESVFPRTPEEEHPGVRERYVERLEYECEMIIRMGFAGYFLIVSDFIRWAKENDIPVGPGRGSGASALVAWSLLITDLDPLYFGLPFERFLNPERVSMPDFDVDFCQERRDEVIAYVAQKYGSDRVAHIITFGSLQARAVLRDVGRVLQMPYGQVDRICKLVPMRPANPITLTEAIAQEPALKEMIDDDPQVAHLVSLSQKLEGLYRHASVHAGGIVIGREPLHNFVPLYQDEGAHLPATEFSLKTVEKTGLVKFDFLGLKTLTVLKLAVDLVKKRGIEVDLLDLPFDDPKTFSMLQRGETLGIFQLESSGMTDVVRRLQPESFEEIIALIALYRPGPMDDIPRYIACRHGHETVTYPYPCLESILKETYGVMTYQEQVMQIARVLAGYSMAAADNLRRAMAKKVKSEMEAHRSQFIEGTLAHHGGDESKAAALFEQISRFSDYAFPKAHAAPYALIVLQTAYMKAHHPVEFMAALMTSDMQNTDKLRVFAREIARMGITLLPPDINASAPEFSVEQMDDGSFGIRYGLAAIRNVGRAAMERLCCERIERGPFSDIYDVVERMDGRILNKKQMEALIAAGAYDRFNPNRRQLMASVELLLRHGAASENEKGQSLFSQEVTRPALPALAEWSAEERLENELAYVGFYLSSHPLLPFVDDVPDLTLFGDLGLSEGQDTERDVVMFGVVMSVKKKISKSSKTYAFVQLSDPSGVFDVTVFSDTLMRSGGILEDGKFVVINAKARGGGGTVRITVESVSLLESYIMSQPLILTIHSQEQLTQLSHVLQGVAKGSGRIFLKMAQDKGRDDFLVSIDSGFSLSRDVRLKIRSGIGA